jgi:hypothetical protein
MHRKGFVQVGGQWITREENAERVREAEEREASRASLEAAEASRRTADALAQLAFSAQTQGGPAVSGPYGDGGVFLSYGYGGGYLSSGGFGSRGHHGSHSGRTGGPWRQQRLGGTGGNGFDQLIGRQPGSLFPVGTGNFSAPPSHPSRRH